MNKDKVFVGYNQQLDRCLLYEKSECCYLDLETGKNYHDFEILDTPRIRYDNLVDIASNQSRWKIKKEYQKEENEIISLEDIFIGNVHQVTDVLRCTSRGTNILNFRIEHDLKTVPIFYDRLLQRDVFLNYIDLFTGEKYNDEMLISRGSFYVPDKRSNLKLFNQVFGECYTTLPKYKVLEKYQEKYNLKNVYRKY